MEKKWKELPWNTSFQLWKGVFQHFFLTWNELWWKVMGFDIKHWGLWSRDKVIYIHKACRVFILVWGIYFTDCLFYFDIVSFPTAMILSGLICCYRCCL
jgi:hypothetical protein